MPRLDLIDREITNNALSDTFALTGLLALAYQSVTEFALNLFPHASRLAIFKNTCEANVFIFHETNSQLAVKA